MATISANTNEKVYSIPKWLGLNEHPDGLTGLKMGEACTMTNWRITRDGHLKRRPNTELLKGLRQSYQLDESDTATTFGPMKGTDEMLWYSIANVLTDPGRVVLDTITTTTVAAAAETASEWLSSDRMYGKFDDHEYAFTKDSFVYDSTRQTYTLSVYLVQSVPTVNADRPVAGMWSGYCAGKQCFLAACDGKLYSLYNATTNRFQRDLLYSLDTTKKVSFIPFDGKVYILNGTEYYVYNGTSVSVVAGYVPLIAIAIGPLDTDTDENSTNDTASNPGELTSEYVNRLTPKRRVWISPDGTNGTFQLPETGLKSIDYVKDLSTGNNLDSGWTGAPLTGQVAFSTIPARAVNSYEIGYTAYCHSDSGYSSLPDYRGQVTGNLFFELFSGTTDTRIFLYGDGTNRTIYSGMDYDGMPRADYFPDQYEARIGDSNTPITAMIRHYSSLICYKPNECWAIQHGVVELATNDLTPAIYSQPVNRDIGNLAPGQVRLVNNNPVTIFSHDLYSWSNSSYYTSNLSRDERQARRISDRVHGTLKNFNSELSMMWDDNDAQEFYVGYGNNCLVWNYANDTWYRYIFPFTCKCMCNFQGELFVGTLDGKVIRMSDNIAVNGDDGWPITASWISGAMDFGSDYMRKFSSMLWVGIAPVDGTSVDVSLVTDRKDTFRTKVVYSNKAKTEYSPFLSRIKLKAKKFEYYYFSLSITEKMPPTVVTNVDFRVRTTGYAR